MKKIILGAITVGLLSTTIYAKNIEQTICFSKTKINEYNGHIFYSGALGDGVLLYGGKCKGRTLSQMNKKGWRLIQVVNGLNSAFGMVLEK